MDVLKFLLIIGTGLFFIGAFGFLTRRNILTMLIAVELMLNGAALNLLAFNRYLWPDRLDGLFLALFIIAIAAAEAAVFIAIVLRLYRNMRTVDVERVSELKQ
ncbi:MAG: NADH-quinone oxidoreductase subunit NuoK [Chitinophagales bacterium]|nr:NADH-quinone oxidoreductase subunit NuoK [Chitinophagales bacterium]MDW8427634.1 NADH-quinone oxidoreductase subunit NuoK [Chitinophagales bacterium]